MPTQQQPAKLFDSQPKGINYYYCVEYPAEPHESCIDFQLLFRNECRLFDSILCANSASDCVDTEAVQIDAN